MATPGPSPVPTDARPAAPTAPFADLGVPASLCAVLTRSGILDPFPIQAMTLPDALAGRDVLGRGRTGSGKTLAFTLPIAARLADDRHDDRRCDRRGDRQGNAGRRRGPRALILAPTRELVRQIDATLTPLATAVGLRSTTVFGGVPAGNQIRALSRGVDIVVACPGRLEDLQQGGHVDLSSVEITVLDEADHMADLGFLPGVTRILNSTPRAAQRLLFSATLDNAVDGLVSRFLRNPVVHEADDIDASVERMEHRLLRITPSDRVAVLVELLSTPHRSVVFTRTKHRARQLTRQLVTAGVPAVEMHGNLTQGARTRNLAAFRDGTATTMVATDIAARGIHIDDVRLVVHADPPAEHKSYLHRSGRTARAGAAGIVVTLATDEQHAAVRTLNRKAGIDPIVTVVAPGHPLLREISGDPLSPLPPKRPAAATRGRTRRTDRSSPDRAKPGGPRRHRARR